MRARDAYDRRLTPPPSRDERDRRFAHRSRSRESRDVIIDYDRRERGRSPGALRRGGGPRDDVADYDREKDRFNFDSRRPSASDVGRRPRTRSRSPRARRSDPDFGMAARLSGGRERDRSRGGGRFDSNGRFRPEANAERMESESERKDAKPASTPTATAPPKPSFETIPGARHQYRKM